MNAAREGERGRGREGRTKIPAEEDVLITLRIDY